MGLFSSKADKKSLEAEKQRLQRLQTALDEQKLQLQRRTVALDEWEESLRRAEQYGDSLISREASLKKREGALLRFENLLGTEADRLSRQERSLLQAQDKLNEDNRRFRAAVAAFKLDKAIDGHFSHVALSPTFDHRLFGNTRLGKALIEYDFENDKRLFTALGEDIVFTVNKADMVFKARSSDGAHEYTVTLNSCTCPDFSYRHVPACKHMFSLAVALGWVAGSDAESLKQHTLRFEEQRLKLARTQAHVERKNSLRQQELEEQSVALVLKDKELNRREQQFKRLIHDTYNTYPFISTILADFEYAQDMQISKALLRKHPPAKKAAKEVAKKAKEKRELVKELKQLQYKLQFYQAAAPWVEDMQISAEELGEMIKSETFNPTNEYSVYKEWLSPEEYSKLSTVEKFQLALNRYKAKRKSNWAAGVEYERYVGYLFESSGFRVHYSGALKGREDLGRDLIAQKGSNVYIVQCKRWHVSKQVHEKHVFQLFGSTFEYELNNPDNIVKGVLVSTCSLSDLALRYAEALKIEHVELPFDVEYPRVKCNLSRDGRKLYHLPFDQQYDRIVISPELGEFYVDTVRAAEDAGFTHAKHWLGSGK